MRSSQVFWGAGGKGHLFKGAGEEMPQKTMYLGTGSIRKQIFDLGEHAHLFLVNKGTGTPWEGLKHVNTKCVTKQNLEKSDL